MPTTETGTMTVEAILANIERAVREGIAAAKERQRTDCAICAGNLLGADGDPRYSKEEIRSYMLVQASKFSKHYFDAVKFAADMLDSHKDGIDAVAKRKT